MDNNELIVVRQLPVIEEQLKAVKKNVIAKVEQAKSLVCTEETVKSVKTVRAELNKEFKEFETLRKEVKAKVLKPYEDFENTYKECVSEAYKSADADLKNKIDDVENGVKEQKQSEVVTYFNEYLANKNIDFITYEQAHINVTLSSSMKSLKEQAKAFIDKVADDIALIDTQEHKDEIFVEYKQNLNVSASITSVSNRYKMIEQEKAKREAFEKEQQATVQAVEKVEEAVEEFKAPDETVIEEDVNPTETVQKYEVSFKIVDTLEKIKALKEFLKIGEFNYEQF